MKRKIKKLNDAEKRAMEMVAEGKVQYNSAHALICYFDGCCEPYNPGGNMGIGATIRVNGNEIFQYSKFVAKSWDNSNNVAEYMAFEAILDFIKERGITGSLIHVCGDSKLVIMQMQSIWLMKGGRYMPYAKRCLTKLSAMKKDQKLSFTLQWIPRGQNHYADELSKAQLIKHHVEFKIQPIEQ